MTPRTPVPGTRAAAALGLAAVLALTGCTGGGGTAAPSAAPTTTSTSSPAPLGTGTPLPAESPGGDAAGGGTDDGGTDGGSASGGGPAAGTGSGGGSSPARLDVVVTFAGWNAATSAAEVGAYVTVLEDGGTCTLRLTGPGGTTAEAVTTAVADATTTSCGLLSVPRDRLTAGTWSGEVSYTSASSSGRAAVQPMEIP